CSRPGDGVEAGTCAWHDREMVERISRYIAVGDSFTEGLWDPYPAPRGEPDVQRGWADRLAESLSSRRVAAGLPALEYANHAIRGRLLAPILRDQVPLALSQEPDLISIVGGGNDILRPGTDPDALARILEDAVTAARRAGARVLLGTGMDPIDLPLVRSTRQKVALFNAHVWSIANRQGAAVLDLWGLRALRHPSMWAGDKMHLSPHGHHRLARAARGGRGSSPTTRSRDRSRPPRAPGQQCAGVRLAIGSATTTPRG